MKRLEKSIEQACVRIAKAAGWETRKMNGLGFRDWPDRLFIPPRKSQARPQARPFWVEFKRPGKKATPSQWHRIEDLRERGESVSVIDNVEVFKEVLRAHSN